MNCVICKSNDTKRLIQNEQITLYLCKNCGFEFKEVSHDTNLNTQLNIYDIHNYNYRKENNAFFVRIAKRRIDILKKYINFGENKLNILEIGCSSGEFLHIVKEMGHDVTGIELSEYACKLAKELFNLDIFNGTLEEFCRINTKKYDLIVTWHVIEHIEAPLNFLSNLMNLLNNNGELAFCTPNIESADVNFVKYASPVYLTDDHVSFFRIACIKNIIEQYYNNSSTTIFTIEPIQSFWFSIINYFIFKFKLNQKRSTNNVSTQNTISSKGNDYLRTLKKTYDKLKIPFILTYITFPFIVLRKKYLEQADKGHELYCIIIKNQK